MSSEGKRRWTIQVCSCGEVQPPAYKHGRHYPVHVAREIEVAPASEVEQYQVALQNLYDAWKDGSDTSLAVARAHELLEGR